MGYTKRVNRSMSKGRSRARSRKGGMLKAINQWTKEKVDALGEETKAEQEHREIRKISDMERGNSPSPPPPSSPPPKVGGKRRKTRRGRKSKKHYKKGSASKSRKGRKDFVTHKGDKKFHRRGHRQSKPQKNKSMLAKLLGL